MDQVSRDHSASRASSARRRPLLLVALFFLTGALAGAPFTTALAQQDDDGTSTRDDAEPLEIDKQAYYTHTLGEAAPPILTNQFPPQVVCLLVPDLCTEELEPITQPGNDLVQENQPEDTVPALAPTGLAFPGDLPTSILAGAPRHEAALKFTLPEVPDNHEIDEFKVFLTETQPTFHTGSPAFRQTMLALLALSQEDPSELQNIPDEDLLATDEFTGVEACTITEPFEEGPSQEGEASPSSNDDLNCIFGANGQRVVGSDGENTYWVFDLTLAANNWLEGDLDNEGILIRPIRPPNLAYGDPDLSTSQQVTFEGEAEEGDAEAQAVAPAATLTTSEKSDPIALGGTTQPPSSQSATPAATPRTPSGGTEVFGSPEATPVDRGGSVPSSGTQQAAPAGSSDPVTSPVVWLLLPIFIGAMYLTSEALAAEAAPTVERSGAMTRLLRARREDLSGALRQ